MAQAIPAPAPLPQPVFTQPFVDQSIDPDDGEDSRLDDSQYIEQPTDINVPLMNASARAMGMAGAKNPKTKSLGFFREAGKAIRNMVGMEKVSSHELLSDILDDDECNPVALAAQLDAATSKEWRGWLPETLCDFLGVTEVDVVSRDKLLATQVGVSNPDVFSEWALFCACSSAFNHRRSNFQWLDKPTYIEAAWTCFTLRQLQPGVEFHDGVTRFLVALMLEDGLCFFPWIGGAGLGLGVNDDSISVGLTDVRELASKVKTLWDAGELHDITPGDHDDSDPLHVQLAKIAAAQAYIHAQHASRPSDYKPHSESTT